MRASQKYGIDWSIVVAGTRWSTQVPRCQPAEAPRPMPSTNEMIVASPTRTRVQGSALAMSSVTGVGYFVTEIPRSPWSTRPQ